MSATPADTLRAIIASVEEAERADRELDAEIAAALDWMGLGNELWERRRGGEFVDRGCYMNKVYAPHFSASLDAAVSLVPSGWQWTACMRDTMLGDDTGEGHVHNGELNMSGKRRSFDVFAATPALALTAAALRARLAMMEDGA